MILKTLEKCAWDEIEIGEIFAWKGCWMILEKDSQTTSRAIACDNHEIFLIDTFEHFWNCCCDLYKLPKSVQKLWKEE